MKQPSIKTKEQIQNITDSCSYLTEMLYYLREHTKAWMTLLEVENLSQDWLDKRNLKWAFKNYDWFPANLCLSVNDCVVHGIPDDTILVNGDLLKIDAWVIYKKGFSDAAISMIIWDEALNPLGADLIRATKESLDLGIDAIETWKEAYWISKAIYNHIKNSGFEVIKTLCWHWVGNAVHEMPLFYNYPNADMKKIILQPWMVIAIEPITAVVSTDVVFWELNDWNLYCKKWDLWAQWEYTVLITENWPKILAWITDDF